jgi:hypothetical protein
VVDDEGSDASGDEGATLTTNGSFLDADGDTLTITASGDGDVTDNGDGTWSWSLETTDNGSGTVVVNANDGEHDTTDTFQWSAANVPPTASLTDPPASNPEGTAISLTGSFTDPGSADTHTQTWAVTKNGSPYASGSGSSVTFTPNDNGTYVATYTVTDDDNGSDTDTKTINVTNVAPTATLTDPPASNPEGTATSLTGSFTDPGSADTHTQTWAVTKNGSPHASGSGSSVTFTPNDNGTYVATYTVTDDDNGSDNATQTINVSNVDPTVTLSNSNTYSWPESASAERTFSYSATDPAGLNDPLTITIDCGTGSGGNYVAGSDTGSSFKCLFPDGPASPTVQVSADDGDGGTDSDSHAVTVSNVDPTINGFGIVKQSGAACQGATNTVTVSFTVSDPAAQTSDPITGTIDWGDGSAAQAIAGRTISQTHSYAAGSYVVTVSVDDGDGGTDTDGGNTVGAVALLYATSGILQPINSDKTSNFKLGSTLPVKIRITDCTGASVPNLTPHVGLVKVGAGGGTANEAVPESVPDEGNDMRYTDGQYIYNLSTKRSTLVSPAGPLQLGSYKVWVEHASIPTAYGYFDIVK